MFLTDCTQREHKRLYEWQHTRGSTQIALQIQLIRMHQTHRPDNRDLHITKRSRLPRPSLSNIIWKWCTPWSLQQRSFVWWNQGNKFIDSRPRYVAKWHPLTALLSKGLNKEKQTLTTVFWTKAIVPDGVGQYMQTNYHNKAIILLLFIFILWLFM